MVDVRMLNEIVAIALEAGARILALRDRSIAIRAKADGSPVTQADIASNEIISQRLGEKFAEIPLVSEEAPAKGNSDARYCFLVDPLDGTKEFVRGSDEFTVNIALLDGATPVAGTVYAPALGVIYAGALGHGARRANVENGTLGVWQSIAAPTPLGDLRAVISRSHVTPETGKFLDRYPIGKIVSVGSSLKFCIVAAGEADIYPRMGRTMEWDTAAGDAILRSAGGSVLTLDRQPLRYRKRDEAGRPALENPWFVAAGAFDPFDARWRREGNKTGPLK